MRVCPGRTLLVYSKSAACFWHFDSMSSGSSVPPHAWAIATKLAPLLVSAALPAGSTIEVAARSTPRQANGFDCGVYVLAIAEWLCTRVVSDGDGGEGEGAAADLSTVDALSPAAITAKRAAIAAMIHSLAGR